MHHEGFMDEAARAEITTLLHRWSEGDEGSFDRLVALVYDDLRHLAHHHLRLGARGATVETTDLVHEAWLRLAHVEGASWAGREQFFAFCSKAMRRILIDYARRRSAQKRGGPRIRVPLREEAGAVEDDVSRVLEVEEALQQLERHDPRMGRIAECRYFGGMSVEETARGLGISQRTVAREWARAKAYLSIALRDGEGNGPQSL